jgi:hypothetical protein
METNAVSIRPSIVMPKETFRVDSVPSSLEISTAQPSAGSVPGAGGPNMAAKDGASGAIGGLIDSRA